LGKFLLDGEPLDEKLVGAVAETLMAAQTCLAVGDGVAQLAAIVARDDASGPPLVRRHPPKPTP